MEYLEDYFTSMYNTEKKQFKTLKKQNQMQLHNFTQSIAYCEAKSLSIVMEAYAENCAGDEIMEIGFNPNSGYVYVALENGISICSSFGNGVEYLCTNFETGEETFFDSYSEAELFYQSL